MEILLKPKRQRLIRVDISDRGYAPPDGWRIVDFRDCAITAGGGGASTFTHEYSNKYAIALIEEV